MRTLPDIELVPASVPRTATFRDAAEVLVSHPVTTIAVLDEEGGVVGLFGDLDLVRGVFPAYIGELHHTAFVSDEVLGERTRTVAAEGIEEHMREPVTLDWDTSTVHVAERFLHCDFGALPILEEGRFVGMLGRAEFCRSVLKKRWG